MEVKFTMELDMLEACRMRESILIRESNISY